MNTCRWGLRARQNQWIEPRHQFLAKALPGYTFPPEWSDSEPNNVDEWKEHSIIYATKDTAHRPHDKTDPIQHARVKTYRCHHTPEASCDRFQNPNTNNNRYPPCVCNYLYR